MQTIWNEQIYKWYLDSGAYTKYERKLREILLSVIPDRDTLCDMGCGAALIDMEMAGDFTSVSCIDLDPVVVTCAREEASRRGITNLEILCGDGRKMKGSWDTIMALYHARDSQTIRHYLSLAEKRLVLVTRFSHLTKIGKDKYQALESYDAESMPTMLEREKIPYFMEVHELEHGQPFEKLSEAEAYVKLYCNIRDDALQEYLKEELIETGEERFPYYLPKKKKFCLFVIEKKDLK